MFDFNTKYFTIQYPSFYKFINQKTKIFLTEKFKLNFHGYRKVNS